MITPAQREAAAALDAARPAIGRLGASRSPEDLAADLIDVWTAVEAALRALVGSTVLSGQALIREARQRQLINFEAANALAAFEAVDGRLQNVSYRPTDSDVASARSAMEKLDVALSDRPPVEAARSQFAPSSTGSSAAPGAAPSAPRTPAPAVAAPLQTTRVGGRMSGMVKAIIGAVVVVVIAVGAYLIFAGRGGGDSLQQGIVAYRAGQRETAVSDFNKAVREDPKASLPHVYLARMAREVGNFTLASQELTLALQADPESPVALREMGANLLAQNNYDLARRFYVRAVQADPTDMTAQGYLGCTLVKLGRAQEAAPFLTRAGQGPWSNCTPAAAPGVLPPNPGALTSQP
ncbi:MAG TPA: tetratricopeptide repeat protein [Gemmatimonadaceae bacterium]